MKNSILLALFAAGAVALLAARQAIDARKEFHLTLRPARKPSKTLRAYRPKIVALPAELSFSR